MADAEQTLTAGVDAMLMTLGPTLMGGWSFEEKDLAKPILRSALEGALVRMGFDLEALPAPPVDVDELTVDIETALVEAVRNGQQQGIAALRDLRARLEQLQPDNDHMRYRAGFADATQAARAEAATVLANLTRGVVINPIPPTKET